MYDEYFAHIEHAYRTERYRREADRARLVRRAPRRGLGRLFHPTRR